jgi:S-adenosylmethionine:diacylglycerol 3-amino-3-carboxypropyl transferase
MSILLAPQPGQRGNGRQFILACDPDRSVYLDLLQQSIALAGVGVLPVRHLISRHLISTHLGCADEREVHLAHKEDLLSDRFSKINVAQGL